MTIGRSGIVAALVLAATAFSSAASAQHPAGHAPAAEATVGGPAAPGVRAPPMEAVGQHAGHSPVYFGAVLLDQNELRTTGRGNPIYALEGSAFYGTDYHRVWMNTRVETNPDRGGLERAELQLLYSRLLAYYWDIQAGVRHDFRIDPREGTPARTYGMVALQGLAPGFFEVQLQAFIGERGIPLVRAAASYDLLITHRLVLQPEFEMNFSAGWDRDALIAPGLYRTEIGLRLRYEITREFAPYIGYSFESLTGGASGLSRRLGEKPSQSTAVAGVRIFF